jgi:hypothetical protein
MNIEHLMGRYEAKLNTEEGMEKYQKRMSTVEPVFGQMKQDRVFKGIPVERKKENQNRICYDVYCTKLKWVLPNCKIQNGFKTVCLHQNSFSC